MGTSSCKNWRGDGIVLMQELKQVEPVEEEEEAKSESCVCMMWYG
jgi:hypothetical protein